ncbi:MAG: hydrolase [Acetatifactor sp.]|nr:hydrolase [Acetatifactor sp.]
MIFYTADLHFGHRSVIKFDNRPFADVDEMDNALINLWNQRVSKEDHVYIIGDFDFRNEKSEEWYLHQLKGHKHLVIGNHDGKLLKNAAAMRYFESVDKMMHVSDDGTQICLCHFPLAEWNGFKRGHSHIHGHIHNRKDATWEFMRTRHNAYNAGRIGDCKIRQIIIYYPGVRRTKTCFCVM